MSAKAYFLCLLISGLIGPNFAADASTHDYFKGKTIRIIVGASPGGAFDTYARTIGRHLGKHIPGNPIVAVENMTGAGGLVVANHLYKVARTDALTIGSFNGGLLMGQILDRPGIEFDGRRFEYIGVPAKLDSVCALTRTSGVTSFQKWKDAKSPVKLGGTAPGSNLVDMPKILAAIFHLPTQVITGYKGFADVRLAADSGELDGACGGWDGIKLLWEKQIESGEISIILQGRNQPLPELPKVPLVLDFARSEEDRGLIQAGIHDPALLSLLYSLPPGTPKDRVRLMRKAFMDTVSAPEYLADARKSRLNIEPASGEELEQTVERLFKLPPERVNKLKEILK